MRTVKIGGRLVGTDQPTFIVAEAGVNHNEDLMLAKEHVRQAAWAGADAIKFQTYTAAKLVTRSAPKYWHIGEPDGTTTQYQSFSLLDKLPREGYQELFALARELGILLFSTPFDEESADFLDALGTPAFKIASADLTFHPFLAHVAQKGKPVILSTGGSTIGEIQEAVAVIHGAGNRDVILLHCTLCYPTADEDANLRMIPHMQQVFPDCPIGLSDHTFGILVPAVAVALGARLIEKHFTVDKGLPGSADHKLGVDPPELRELVRNVRSVEKALGRPMKEPVACEQPARLYARRSVVAARDIPKGTILTPEMLICKRPGTGIPPKFLPLLMGRPARADIHEDEVISWDQV